MRKLDFITQTLILVLALGLTLAGLFVEGKLYLWCLLYAQLFIGPWQFLGSLINYVKYLKYPSSLYKTLLSVHFIASTLYLLITALIIDFADNDFLLVWIMILPWILALHYYVLSYLKIKRNHKYHSHKGGFLPHLKL